MDNPNTFTDSRGTIKDLAVTDEYSITHITFTPGAVRGNHYHEETFQFDQILKGKLIFSKDGVETTVEKMDTMKCEPGERHAYKAVEYSEMISICFGKRIGHNYEKDVFRLPENEKLL